MILTMSLYALIPKSVLNIVLNKQSYTLNIDKRLFSNSRIFRYKNNCLKLTEISSYYIYSRNLI